MVMRRRTNIRQHDRTDCAAACIASIAGWYGYSIPLTVIREASGTGAYGTTVKGILDACREIGFTAKGYKSETGDTTPLLGLGCPAILHILKENGDLHFYVLYKINGKKAIVMDPAEGRRVKKDIDTLHKEWSGYLVIMRPDPDFTQFRGKRGHFSKYASLLLLTKRDYSLSLAGAAAYIVAGICTALFLQHIIDNVLPVGDMRALGVTGALMILIMAAALFVGYGQVIFTLRTGITMDSYIILKYINHLFSLPVGFFKGRGAGELNSRIGDSMRIRSFLIEGVTTILTSVLTLAVSFVLMFSFYWKLALMTFAFIPLFCTVYIIAGRINRKTSREIIESAAEFEEKSVEGISSIKVIKYFGNGEHYYRNIERKYVTFAEKLYRGGRYSGIFATSADAISRLLTVCLILIGSLFIFKGKLSVGELVSFYSLTSFFSGPLSQLVRLTDDLAEFNTASERIFEILDLKSEGGESLPYVPDRCEDILFHNVEFSYPGHEPLLSNFNITIPKGQITVIKGASGCGKSSLASLLMRDYKVQKGKITLGDIDISQIEIGQWRDYISIVPQDADLISGTILENITCHDPKPDVERVINILEELGMRQFISGLQMGLLTRTGEHGSRISGGQRQRIALARVLYRDPFIYILDEATSSLDSESEAFILRKLQDLRDKGKTVILITHNKENALIADNTITMSAHS
jgi:ATP-binding cassette subfamily B protein